MTAHVSKQETHGMTVCSMVYIHFYRHLEHYIMDPKRKLSGTNPITAEIYPSWLREAAKSAWHKLDTYYPSTDAMVYIIGTSEIFL